jgi:hypothetical protein
LEFGTFLSHRINSHRHRFVRLPARATHRRARHPGAFSRGVGRPSLALDRDAGAGTPAQLVCRLLRFSDCSFVFAEDSGYGTHEGARI